jgi:hypothetical protein
VHNGIQQLLKNTAETRHWLYISSAEDTIDGRPVTNEEKIAIITQKRQSKTHLERGLAREIELAIGASVMVTLNILTDLDVANGVHGVIEGIVLDEHEKLITKKKEHTVHLQYPPQYLLVRLDRTKAPILEGLPKKVIPIIPVTKSFTMNKDGAKVTVHRTQFPLTLAYAFMDYRLQGQTLYPVFIDIGTPPYGWITPFNAYVALSRGIEWGIGCEGIQLLWDFDETLLQQHPSEHLRLEDDRLLRLNELTKQWKRE